MLFCNIDFKLLSSDDVFKIEGDRKIPKFIIPINASLINIANNDKRFMCICDKYYSAFDGAIPLKIAKIIKKNKHIQKISGSDLGYEFCKYAQQNNLRIFFLGGDAESNRLAVENVKSDYGIIVDGYSPPYENYPFSMGWRDECLSRIMNFRPHVLFVGLGAPKQEFFVDDNFHELSNIGCRYVIACGGTIDFMAKIIKRAPQFIQNFGLEWLYRLIQQPNKMRIQRIIRSCIFFKYIYFKPEFCGVKK